MNKENIDLNAILVKPLYLGMLMNIFFPMTLLIIAYFMSQSVGNDIMTATSDWGILTWLLLGLGVIDGIIAIILRQKLFTAPLIKSERTFENDLKAGTFRISIICYAMTTAISIYGFVLYLLYGDFRTLLFFVLMSFIAFQIVKPRHKFLEKVIEAQSRHVSEGRFYTGPGGSAKN